MFGGCLLTRFYRVSFSSNASSEFSGRVDSQRPALACFRSFRLMAASERNKEHSVHAKDIKRTPSADCRHRLRLLTPHASLCLRSCVFHHHRTEAIRTTISRTTSIELIIDVPKTRNHRVLPNTFEHEPDSQHCAAADPLPAKAHATRRTMHARRYSHYY